MKRILHSLIISLSLISMSILMSCNKDGEKVVASQGIPPALTSTVEMLDYTEADTANAAVTFNWTKSDYGYPAEISYSLQISNNDSVFSDYYQQAAGSVLTQAYTVKQLNAILLNAGYAGGVKDTMLVRVQSRIGVGTYIYSDTIRIIVTPYTPSKVQRPVAGPVTYDAMYLPGAYQGWNIGSASIGKIYSPKSDSKYAGYIYITDTANGGGQFLITPEQNFNNKYTEVDSTTMVYNGSDNLSLTKYQGPGYYLLNADVSTLKWSATLQNWSIIGDGAVDWDTDVPLDFDATSQVLVKTLTLKPGGIKFRANNSWDNNIGLIADGQGNIITPVDPKTGEAPLTNGGANVPVSAAGTYKIILDLRVPDEPVFSITKQ